MKKKKIDSEKVLKEAYNNIQKDREKLQEFYNSIKPLLESEDPTIKALFSDGVVRIVDGLTKSNSQLIEISKLKFKQEELHLNAGFDGEKWNENDASVMFDSFDDEEDDSQISLVDDEEESKDPTDKSGSGLN